MHTNHIAHKLLAGVSAFVLLTSASFAAEPADVSAAKKTSGLEEIVVTAQKREQSAQDVPIALNAFSSSFIDTIAAYDITDLSSYTPGLQVSGVTQPNYSIRGVQTDDFGVGTDPAVGVFIDGVYSSRSGAGVVFFSDVERVEVLKGPQGTLFGRNTAAGAISIITNKPKMDETEARVKLRYGRFNERQFDGMINLPLAKTLAMRANLLINSQDGTVRDSFTGKDYGRRHNVTGRVQLRWEPDDKTAFNLAYEFDHTSQDENPPVVGLADGHMRAPLGAQTVGDLPGHGDFLAGIAPLFGLPITKDTPLSTLYSIPLSSIYAGFGAFGYTPANPNADWNFFRDASSVGGANPFGPVSSDIANGAEHRDLDGLTLTITHDFDWAKLTSISAYKHFATDNLQDEDGTNDPNFYFDTNNVENNKNFYQELRLNGNRGRLTWTVGASYYWENAKQQSQTHATMDSIDTVLYNLGVTPGVLAASFNPMDGINSCEATFLDSLGGFISFNNLPLNCLDSSLPGYSLEQLANLGLTTLSGRKWTETMYGEGSFKAYAAFADATYAITDRLNLSAGLRYTHDDKSWTWENGLRQIEGYDRLSIPGVGNLADIQQQLLTSIFRAFVGPTASGDIVFDVGGLEGVPFTRKASWNNVSPRVALDYKIGDDAMVYVSWARGYKAGGFNTVEINSYFGNESVWNVEAGLKSQWFDNRVRFNTSVWKYKYSDKQSIHLVSVDSSSVPRYVTENQDVEGKGVDVEFLWAPAVGLRLFANGGYQDITCTKNCRYANAGDPTGAPTTRISFGADYTLGLGSDKGALSVHLDHSYTSAKRINGNCLHDRSCGTITWGASSFVVGKAQNLTNARITWSDPDDRFSVSFFGRNIFGNRYADGAGGLSVDTFGTPIAHLSMPATWGVDLTATF
ncbi:TonB-dependent receptor [Kordiimonas marina]|uniref:TonB-dependent receptor n=1 Tax=Kordiimonas marina TaxID=2872312 RepID=UPI001FF4761D|nr:TonB-dependent receptor [Kordiimonas marina]MCJ9429848.1 TonB-dependent receptor [Kordiimonas marina]